MANNFTLSRAREAPYLQGGEEVKTVTSRLMRKEHPVLRTKFKEPVLWSRSYFVASVDGAPLSVIKQYIEQQARPL